MSAPPAPETGDIVVEKSVESMASRVATVTCSIRSTGEETCSITVIDSLPTGWPDARLGFHDDRAMEYWRIGDDAMILECELAPGAELEARYAVWLDEETTLAHLRTSPSVEVTGDRRSPTVSIDVIEHDDSIDSDPRAPTRSTADQPAGDVTDSRRDANPSTDHGGGVSETAGGEDHAGSASPPEEMTAGRRKTAARERNATEVRDVLKEQGPAGAGDSDATTDEAVDTNDSADGSRSSAGTTSDGPSGRHEDARMATEVETLSERLGATIERLDELEVALTRSGELADPIEEDFANITDRLDTLDAELDRLHARLSERPGHEPSIDHREVDVDDRFDTLEAELDRIRDEFESDLALLRHDLDIIHDEVDPTIEW